EERRVSELAEQICQVYIDQGTKAVKKFELPLDTMVDHYIVEDVLIACVFDTRTTGDKQIGASSIDVLLSEGASFLSPKNDTEYASYMKETTRIKEDALVEATAQIDMMILTTETTTSGI
ncbi:unnamed protein product, partial [Didymodactylos carnosus]